MDTHDRFSKRHGYAPPDSEISIRQDAPHDLRGVILQIAYEAGLSPKPMRELVCRVLRERPNPDNWSEYPNIKGSNLLLSLVKGSNLLLSLVKIYCINMLCPDH